jgi:hypothetical protein
MMAKFWYTFGTEVVAYSKPSNNLILGIIKQDTAEKLQKANDEDGGFVFMPKHVTRHRPEIFKSTIQQYFQKSLEYIEIIDEIPGYKTRVHQCAYYASIEDVFNINFEQTEDRDFIKLISPFYPWTHKHVYEYLTGKDPEIEHTIGKGAILLFRMYKFDSPINQEYKQADRDSSQIKSFEINQIFNKTHPIHKKSNFDELRNLIHFVFNNTRK